MNPGDSNVSVMLTLPETKTILHVDKNVQKVNNVNLF